MAQNYNIVADNGETQSIIKHVERATSGYIAAGMPSLLEYVALLRVVFQPPVKLRTRRYKNRASLAYLTHPYLYPTGIGSDRSSSIVIWSASVTFSWERGKFRRQGGFAVRKCYKERGDRALLARGRNWHWYEKHAYFWFSPKQPRGPASDFTGRSTLYKTLGCWDE